VNGIAVNRPGRNGTYVHFNDATMNNARVLSFDCGWSPNVIYSGSTIIIRTDPFVWTHNHHYYLTFDSGTRIFFQVLCSSFHCFFTGASSGTEFCRKSY
jgi:hypothetical protein